MLRRSWPLAALLYFLVSFVAHARPEETGAVQGRIVDSVTQRAVLAATVSLLRNQSVHATTESNASASSRSTGFQKACIRLRWNSPAT